jgi:acetyl-CoA carboxylase carboxyltransferase component
MDFARQQKTFSAKTPARKRLLLLLDEGSFVELSRFSVTDGKPCGVICGYGSVLGSPVCVFSQTGGGIGKAEALKISKLYDLALKIGAPVVGIYDSIGARLAEGIASLEGYGEILMRISNLSGVVPQISLVLGDCTGSSAILACGADFVVMSEGASFFVSPPSLATDTAANFGSAKAAARSGAIHAALPCEKTAAAYTAHLIRLLPMNNLSGSKLLDFTAPAEGFLTASGSYHNAGGNELAGAVLDENSLLPIFEGFGTAVYTALGQLAGAPVGVAAMSGDKLCADSCAKMARLVSVCDSFGIPAITFVNSPGFVPSQEAELAGSIREMAKLAHIYAEATTVKLAVISGKAYGAVYVATASKSAGADYAFAYPDAIITPLDPVAAIAFLHGGRITAEKKREQVVKDYIENEASPLSCAGAGYLDDVIPPDQTREALIKALDLFSSKRVLRSAKKHSNIPL